MSDSYISSMTGFARRVSNSASGEFEWEIRSLNHRGLDIHVHVPEEFREVEIKCRRAVSSKFERGRIDATLKILSGSGISAGIGLNESLFNQLLEYAYAAYRNKPDAAMISIAHLLRWPGVITHIETVNDDMLAAVVASLEETVDELVRDRMREGHVIRSILRNRFEVFKSGVKQLREQLPQIERELRNRFAERLKSIDVNIEPGRIEQEIALSMMKLDVREEVDRIQLHVDEFERVLSEEQVVGKKLGFIVQELGREVNTLAAKSANYPISANTVEMRVVLEQIREQLHNIE